MKKIDAVIFDLDGVITNTAHYHFLAWRNLANSLNIEFTEEFNEELKGISRDESLEKILVKGKVENEYSLEEKKSLANKKNSEYVELLKNITPEDILPGIHKFLIDLKKDNIKIGLASASKNATFILDALEISNLFDCVVDPESIKSGKPSPDIFLKATEILAVNPENCIGVEDSIAGINSINDANMFSIGVGTPNEMSKAGANVVVKDTRELTIDLIKEIYV
ncbi:beta-phosphoglucomutase [Clostridium perfringens]|nr:beta-phosphoglucomutase [Clostridium perfringens]